MDTTTEKAIAEAATAGPWLGASTPSGRKYGVVGYHDKNGTGRPLCVLSGLPAKQRHPDTQFIAHARTGYPLALAVVEAAQEWVGKLNGDGADELVAAVRVWEDAS
jgi:hypothetical protein